MVPRCFCLLSRWPLFEAHLAVLRAAAQTDAAGVRELAVRYSRLRPPAPGGELRVRLGATEVSFARPDAASRLAFLGEPSLSSRSATLPPIAREMLWTRREYEAIDATAEWALPLVLSRVPAQTLLRVVAAVLCEMQIVVLSARPALASATVLGVAALARPMLWVGPLVPVLPTQLHAVLEAPVPFFVGAPRTETWVDCLANKLPQPGFVVFDADARALCFHPHDADLLELPHADALLDALAPMLEAFALCAEAGVTPRQRKAARSVQRVVSRHVVKLATAARAFESKQAASSTLRSSVAKSVRTRESVEFAQLLRHEFAADSDDDDARAGGSVAVSRSFVRSSFVGSSLAGCTSASVAWQRRSTELRLDASLAKDPLMRAFFERFADSQSYCVYKECFPSFEGLHSSPSTGVRTGQRHSAHHVLDTVEESPSRESTRRSPRSPHTPSAAADDDDPLLATMAWRPPSPGARSKPLHAPHASTSPMRAARRPQG